MYNQVFKGSGLLVDYTHDGDTPRDVLYASITAPEITYCEIKVDDKLVDALYIGAGSSHSWWATAGGQLFPQPLLKGQHLVITVDRLAALRIDWT